MFKTASIGLFLFTLFLSGCDTRYDLKNTEWLTIKFTIDSSNYLTEFDKKIYLSFDTSTKLHIKFLDTLALIFVENRPIDTSIYNINKDTLFFIQGARRDTSIILKLTSDSLIEHRLAGVVTHNARFKNQ
jgi:hypothetical protein